MSKEMILSILFTAWIVIVGSLIIIPQFDLNLDYRQGQIDALSGNIKYELITNPDSSRTWKEIK